MKNITPFMIVSSLVVSAGSVATEPVCPKCVKIREYNAAHPETNYEWYDDYLKDKEEGKAREREPENSTNSNKKQCSSCSSG